MGWVDLVGLEDLVGYCAVVQEYQTIEPVDLVDRVCSVLADDLQGTITTLGSKGIFTLEVEGLGVAFAFVCTRSFGLPCFGVGAGGPFSAILSLAISAINIWGFLL